MPTSEQIEKAAQAMAFAGRTRHDQSRDASEFWENIGYETRLMHISCARAALSAAEGMKPREDALLESQYRAGYKAGWNAAHSDNAEENYQAAMRYEGHLSALQEVE